jgi:ribosomal protein S18 acetylase RimI-like enzyme
MALDARSGDDPRMRGVSIRVLQPAEWRAYKDLRLRALADSPDAFSTLYADANAQPDEHWASRLLALSPVMDRLLVVERDAALNGMVWGRILSSDETTAHVYQMWVAPELRGLGLGRMLLQRIIEWVTRHGVRSILLGVTYGNGPAYRLYESVGFRAFGELEPLRPNSELQAQTMRLDISSAAP